MPKRASLKEPSGPARPVTPGRTALAGSRTPSRISSDLVDARSASLWGDVGGGEAGSAGWHEEAADAVFGAGPDGGDVGDAAVGDPHLVAGDDAVAAVADGAGAHAGGV